MIRHELRRAAVAAALVLASTELADAGPTHVIWSDLFPPRIHVGQIGSPPASTIDPPVFQTAGSIEFDPGTGMIYFFGIDGSGVLGIHRIRPDGTGLEPIVTDPLLQDNLDLDPGARTLYYSATDAPAFSLYRADMDLLNSNIVKLITIPESHSDLQVDPVGGFAYWTTNTGAQIAGAPLDGSTTATILLAQGFEWTAGPFMFRFRGATALHFDSTTGLLYFAGWKRRLGLFGPFNRFFGTLTVPGGGAPLILKDESEDFTRIESMVLDNMTGNIYFTRQDTAINQYSIPTDQITTVFTSQPPPSNPPAGTDPFEITIAVIPAPDCPGDANGDRVIDFQDIIDILANWLALGCPAGQGTCGVEGVQGDANSDGAVTFDDINAVLGSWQAACP